MHCLTIEKATNCTSPLRNQPMTGDSADSVPPIARAQTGRKSATSWRPQVQEPALCSKPDGLLKLAGMGCVKLEKVTERNWWEYWEGRRNDNLKFERSREESLQVTCETGTLGGAWADSVLGLGTSKNSIRASRSLKAKTASRRGGLHFLRD